MLDSARADRQLRGRSVRLSLLAVVALVIAPIWWLTHLPGEPLRCTTTSSNTAAALDSILRDPRVHVERLRLVPPNDGRNRSYESGSVYVDDVYVGTGTWWSNFVDIPSGELGRYSVLQPANDLARAVSVDRYDFAPPDEGDAARFSQRCVTGS